jgi:hypothetical protein
MGGKLFSTLTYTLHVPTFLLPTKTAVGGNFSNVTTRLIPPFDIN